MVAFDKQKLLITQKCEHIAFNDYIFIANFSSYLEKHLESFGACISNYDLMFHII